MNRNEASSSDVRPGRREWLKWMGGAALAPAVGTAVAAKVTRRGPRADYFPNVVVHTHQGDKRRFYDDLVHGKVVIFNMMYTACTGICPGNTANLLQVQQLLGDAVGKDVFMYSMTLQPEFDTPAALREYVSRYGIKPGWTFLTAAPGDMHLLRRKLGFFDDDLVVDTNLNDHTGMIRVGNEPLDRWFMMPSLLPARQIARAVLEQVPRRS
jgi:protein SCO1/2